MEEVAERGDVIPRGEAVILAGGRGKRLGGVDKSRLLYRGRPFYQYLRDQLALHFDEIYISTSRPEDWTDVDLPVIADLSGPASSLLAVYSSLSYCRGDWLFVVACDTPLLKGELVEFLRSRQGKAPVIAPVDDEGRALATWAFYHRRCRCEMRAFLDRNQCRLQGILEVLDADLVPPREWCPYDREQWCTININAPDDWERLDEIDQ